MAYMLIRHKVAEFEKWKQAYEDHRSSRQAAGLKDVHLWRNAEDPNEVIVLFEASDVANAILDGSDAVITSWSAQARVHLIVADDCRQSTFFNLVHGTP